MSRRTENGWIKGIWKAMKIYEILRENQEKDLMDRRRSEEWSDKYGIPIDCSNSYLTSLKGAPREVDGYFNCSGNPLGSLEWAPRKVVGDFHCRHCSLTSLNDGPTQVAGDYYCFENPITSFIGIGSYFKNGYIKGDLVIPATVESHMLGILLIPKLQSIYTYGATGDLRDALSIIKKHLAGNRDILECQEELRTAGLREFGKL